MSSFGTEAELAEAEAFLAAAKTDGVRNLLKGHIKAAKARLEAAPPAAAAAADTAAPTPAPAPAPAPAAPKVPVNPRAVYQPITDFAWDQGGYNTSTLSIFIDLPDVGTASERVNCVYGKHSIDLTVLDLHGKSHRLINEHLEKDIVPAECKTVVKAHKIVLKLVKAKGQYSYESWTQLTAKKPRDDNAEASKKADPAGGIMDMMKNLYDEGDENMKKIIGEAMLKSQRGEKGAPPSFDDA